MTLLDNDLKTISQKINLPIYKTKSLTEEDQDLNLILNCISNNLFSKKDRRNLSYPTYCQLIINRIIKDLDFPEKNWIANSISQHFHTFKKSKSKNIEIPAKLKEDEVSYYFTLVALYPQKFNLSINLERLKIRVENGLYMIKCNTLARNLDSYLKLIRLAQDEGWFD